jgi:hypothetical protein
MNLILLRINLLYSQHREENRRNWFRPHRWYDWSLMGQSRHPAVFSSRHPEELKDLVTGLGSLARADSVTGAIGSSDVLFVAVPYGAIPLLAGTTGKR